MLLKEEAWRQKYHKVIFKGSPLKRVLNFELVWATGSGRLHSILYILFYCLQPLKRELNNTRDRNTASDNGNLMVC
jgi:hypothetical protein